jgi:hypothetical protein
MYKTKIHRIYKTWNLTKIKFINRTTTYYQSMAGHCTQSYQHKFKIKMKDFFFNQTFKAEQNLSTFVEKNYFSHLDEMGQKHQPKNIYWDITR